MCHVSRHTSNTIKGKSRKQQIRLHPEDVKKKKAELDKSCLSGADDGSCSGARHLAAFPSLLRVAHAQFPSDFPKNGSGSDTKATDDNNLLLQSFSQTRRQLKNV